VASLYFRKEYISTTGETWGWGLASPYEGQSV
jgi:hypothetical protein